MTKQSLSMRYYFLIVIAYLLFAISGCNQKQNKSIDKSSSDIEVAESDWTENQKKTIFMISKSSAKANSNPVIKRNADKIAQKTLDRCIRDYPNYYEFAQTRRNWYNIYTTVSKSYKK
ncbi:hypothetical protein [Pedobacter agri]|uniref:hypothetical protein n=1 Tax=Pedobacter agri TaxID=454586 RepID=UPI00292CC6BF|nr:hypothetical protein [Pedobacter agri]